MATGNFPIVNTNNYYCFGHQSEERESWDWAEWQFYFDDYKDFIKEQMKQNPEFIDTEKEGAFGLWRESVDFGGFNLAVTYNLYIHSGYYSGYCFDFDDLDIEGIGFEVKEITQEDAYYILECYYDQSVGWMKMQKKNLAKHLEQVRQRMEAKINEMFAKLCEDKLQVSCRFSNGEVWYERCAV